MLSAVLARWERSERSTTTLAVTVAGIVTMGSCAYLLGRQHGRGRERAVGRGAVGTSGSAAAAGAVRR
jgi:hypothetical protein